MATLMNVMTESKLERETPTPAGFVTVRRIVEHDGSFAPVAEYATIERDHIWRRDDGESVDVFDSRVIDEAEWYAVRRGRKVALIPFE